MNLHLTSAHGSSSATKHIGQCNGEEIGVERDDGVHWLQFKLFCKISKTMLAKMSQVMIVPSKTKGSEDASFLSFTKIFLSFHGGITYTAGGVHVCSLYLDVPAFFQVMRNTNGWSPKNVCSKNISFPGYSELIWVKWVHPKLSARHCTELFCGILKSVLFH